MQQEVQATVTRSAVPVRPPSMKRHTRRSLRRWNIAEWFILSQTFLPAVLYLPGTQPLRVPIRMASYGISLAILAYYWVVMRSISRRSFRPHPAVPWLVGCLICLGFMLLHPTTNSYKAGLAQIGVYFSILAPVFLGAGVRPHSSPPTAAALGALTMQRRQRLRWRHASARPCHLDAERVFICRRE